MNRLLGHDFSHVRIHADAGAAQAAELLGARALAFGSHVYFGAGQFAPGTPAGDRLLVHELVHVVQFDEGRLPEARGSGLEVSRPEDGAEREAEARAHGLDGGVERAEQGRPSEALPEALAATISGPLGKDAPSPLAPIGSKPMIHRDGPGTAPTGPTSEVGEAVDKIIEALRGITFGGDSAVILAQFTGKNPAMARAILAELKARARSTGLARSSTSPST